MIFEYMARKNWAAILFIIYCKRKFYDCKLEQVGFWVILFFINFNPSFYLLCDYQQRNN